MKLNTPTVRLKVKPSIYFGQTSTVKPSLALRRNQDEETDRTLLESLPASVDLERCMQTRSRSPAVSRDLAEDDVRPPMVAPPRDTAPRHHKTWHLILLSGVALLAALLALTVLAILVPSPVPGEQGQAATRAPPAVTSKSVQVSSIDANSIEAETRSALVIAQSIIVELQQNGFSVPRSDMRCGPRFRNAGCDRTSATPCCATRSGWCGITPKHCIGRFAHDHRVHASMESDADVPSPFNIEDAMDAHKRMIHGESTRLSAAQSRAWWSWQRHTAAELHAALPSDTVRQAKLRLAVVVAVSNELVDVEQWERNTARLLLDARTTGDEIVFHFYHYDGASSRWVDASWYQDLVAKGNVAVHEAHERGCKYNFWKRFATEHVESEENNAYTFLTDADMDYRLFSWRITRGILLSTRPWIATPMVVRHSKHRRHFGAWLVENNMEHAIFCNKLSIAHTPPMDGNGFHRAEEGAVILSSSMWRVLAVRLSRNADRTDWGLDIFWTDVVHILANGCQHSSRSNPPWIILDASPVIHMDTGSLTRSTRTRPGQPLISPLLSTTTSTPREVWEQGQTCLAKCGDMCGAFTSEEYRVLTNEVWSPTQGRASRAAKCPAVFNDSSAVVYYKYAWDKRKKTPLPPSVVARSRVWIVQSVSQENRSDHSNQSNRCEKSAGEDHLHHDGGEDGDDTNTTAPILHVITNRILPTYTWKQCDGGPSHIEVPTLIFSINPGRSGSKYLYTLLKHTARTWVEHEQKGGLTFRYGWAPADMHGGWLYAAIKEGLGATVAERGAKVRAIRKQIDKMHALHPGQRVAYIETSHLFVEDFYDVVLDAFDACHYDVRVIVLRRFLPELINSHMRVAAKEATPSFRYWESKQAQLDRVGTPLSDKALRSQITKTYYYQGALDNKLAILPRCTLGDAPSEVQNLIGYLYDVEAHVAYIHARYPTVPFYAVRLAELEDLTRVKRLFRRLGLRNDPRNPVRSVIGVRVNAKGASHRSTEEEEEEEDIATWGGEIAQFEADCAAAGVALPPMVNKKEWDADAREEREKGWF